MFIINKYINLDFSFQGSVQSKYRFGTRFYAIHVIYGIYILLCLCYNKIVYEVSVYMANIYLGVPTPPA